MSVTLRRIRLAATAGLVAAMALAVTTGCSTKSGSGADASGRITLTLDTFGAFGYDDLIKQYETDHPTIKIENRVVNKLDDYTPKLTQYLASGSGAGDVVALEEQVILKFKAQAQNFVDLKTYGADTLKDQYLPWKWTQGTTQDGKVVGLGTDIGPMAMCYRTDLFAKAGLPTNRDEVAKLWPTWDDYVKTGEKFTAAKTGGKFVDDTPNIFNAILLQAAGNADTGTYIDKDGKLILDSNPAVKTAWDATMKMISGGLSANLTGWSPAWNSGFKQAAFATLACPAWMLGTIKEQAGDEGKGKWDVAALPGGGGNWGGSFLAVPTQSKHPKEAADLAKFLTTPASQIAAFKKAGGLPSDVQALADPALQGSTDPYFNNAPVGKIFGDGSKALKPVYLAPKDQDVRTAAIEPAIQSIEQGKATADQGWQKLLADAKGQVK